MLVPHLSGFQAGGQGEGQIFCVIQLGRIPIRADQAHPVAVQDVQLAVAAVHAQGAGVGVEHLGHLPGPVLLPLGGGGQVVI